MQTKWIVLNSTDSVFSGIKLEDVINSEYFETQYSDYKVFQILYYQDSYSYTILLVLKELNTNPITNTNIPDFVGKFEVDMGGYIPQSKDENLPS